MIGPTPRRLNDLLSRLTPAWVAAAIPVGVKTQIRGGVGKLSALESALEKKADAELRSAKKLVTRADLDRDLAALPIAPGATVFVHSALSKLGYVDGGAQAVVDALIARVIGTGGTLALPSFTMTGTMHQAATETATSPFDVRCAPTGIGAIAENFRQRAGVVRSIHPSHSVIALGPKAKWLTADHHRDPRAFGPMSPLGRLLEDRGCLLGLGTDLGPLTFYHVLEDLDPAFPIGVYTVDSPIVTKCIDHDGHAIDVPVMTHESSVSGDRIDRHHATELRKIVTSYFENAGVLSWHPVGDGRAWVMGSDRMYAGLRDLMQRGITIYLPGAEANRRVFW